MSKRDLLGIIAKNISIAAVDSFSTAVMIGDSSYALGGLASATGKTIEEVKQHLKDSNDGLYHLHVKTFFETADVEPEKFEQFIKDNPNQNKLGAEFLKILETTVFEEQAKMYAKAFSLFVKRRISETDMNKYVYIIGKLDKHILDEVKKLEGYRANPRPREYTQQGQAYLDMREFIPNANEELCNFGFVQPITNIFTDNSVKWYGVTHFYIKFKQEILNDN